MFGKHPHFETPRDRQYSAWIEEIRRETERAADQYVRKPGGRVLPCLDSAEG